MTPTHTYLSPHEKNAIDDVCSFGLISDENWDYLCRETKRLLSDLEQRELEYERDMSAIYRKVVQPGSPPPGGIVLGILIYVDQMRAQTSSQAETIARLEKELATAKEDYEGERRFIEKIESWVGASTRGSLGTGIQEAVQRLRTDRDEQADTIRRLRGLVEYLKPYLRHNTQLDCQQIDARINEALSEPSTKPGGGE